MSPSLTTGSGGMIGSESDHGQRRGQGATPAAFYLGLCRLRGILSPPASATVILQAGNSYLSQRWCCRRAVLRCSSDGAAGWPFLAAAVMALQRFPSLGLKSRITARWRLFPGNPCSDSQIDPLKSRITAEPRSFPGKTMQRFPSLGLKSRITARKRA